MVEETVYIKYCQYFTENNCISSNCKKILISKNIALSIFSSLKLMCCKVAFKTYKNDLYFIKILNYILKY